MNRRAENAGKKLPMRAPGRRRACVPVVLRQAVVNINTKVRDWLADLTDAADDYYHYSGIYAQTWGCLGIK